MGPHRRVHVLFVAMCIQFCPIAHSLPVLGGCRILSLGETFVRAGWGLFSKAALRSPMLCASKLNKLIDSPGWNSVGLFFDCSLEPQKEGVNIVNIFSREGFLQ